MTDEVNKISQMKLLSIMQEAYPGKVVKVQYLYNTQPDKTEDDYEIIAVLMVRNTRDDDLT